jgi:predicted phosphodiesterase
MGNTKWGAGTARGVPSSTREKVERVAFYSDIHAPYHDPQLVASALDLVRRFEPHRVVLLGDLLDFHAISRWNASMERLDDLQDEIDIAMGILADVRAAAPDAALDLVLGNHDVRMRRYIMEHGRALASLRALDLGELIGAKDVELTIHEPHGFLLRQDFLVKHGDVIRKGAGSSAKAECLSAGISGISGHSHRLASWRQTGYTSLRWTEAGTLSRIDPPYTIGPPDHQQGMAVGHFQTKGRAWTVEEVQALDGQLVWGGQVF